MPLFWLFSISINGCKLSTIFLLTIISNTLINLKADLMPNQVFLLLLYFRNHRPLYNNTIIFTSCFKILALNTKHQTTTLWTIFYYFFYRINSRKNGGEWSGRKLIQDTTILVKRISIDWHHVQESGTWILLCRGSER